MRFILGILIGVAAGAVFGLVVAPKSGRETRDAIRKRVQHNAEEAQEALPANA